MIPISIKVRGAIGLRDGLGVEEVSIDFTKFAPGLIAIVGDNGSGKTTTLSQLTPFLTMPGREGALSNQFFLKDSCRDFSFRMNGSLYRAMILIDGRTGKTEPYLYRDGKPLNDGKVGTYKPLIDELLGSEDIFFRSVYASQKAQSISSLTAGQRKELFIELLGLQRYSLYEQVAKTEADAIEKSISEQVGRASQITGELEKETEIAKLRDELVGKAGRMQEIISANAELSERRAAEIREQRDKIIVDDGKKAQVGELDGQIGRLIGSMDEAEQKHKKEIVDWTSRRDELQQSIQRQQKILEHGDEIKANVDRLKKLEEQITGLNEKRRKVLEFEAMAEKDENRYQAAVAFQTKQVNGLETERQKSIHERQIKVAWFESQAKHLERQITDFEEAGKLIDVVPCKDLEGIPAQCPLLSKANDANKSLPELRKNKTDYESDEWRAKNGLREIDIAIERIVKQKEELLAKPIPPAKKYTEEIAACGFDDTLFETLTVEFATLDRKGKWKQLAEELAVAQGKFEELQKSLVSIMAQEQPIHARYKESREGMEKQVLDLKAKRQTVRDSLLTTEFYSRYSSLNDEYKNLLGSIETDNRLLADLKAEIAKQEALLARLEELKSEAETIVSGMKDKQLSLERWRLAQRGCSKEGIPALELDAAGPEVSRRGNELLIGPFGMRHQMAFETTRMDKKGKKQIETFDIRIYGPDGEKKIEDLSGGEEVWIEAALRQAIASYMRSQTRRDLATRFLDEADGPLSGEKAQNYLDMIRISHEREKYHFTFLISHRQDLVAQIQQRIVFHPESHSIECIY